MTCHSSPAQADAIRDYLSRGKRLTPLDALRRFGCMRLGARIWELRKEGVMIEREMVRKGNKVVACYYIP